jgi:hypothetical protein
MADVATALLGFTDFITQPAFTQTTATNADRRVGDGR